LASSSEHSNGNIGPNKREELLVIIIIIIIFTAIELSPGGSG
jgi:hypothetical protein